MPRHGLGLFTALLTAASSAWGARCPRYSGSSLEAYLGFAVAVSGADAMVGAPNGNAGAGEVRVLGWDGSAWTSAPALTASDAGAGDFFGQAIGLDGDVAIVGAPYDDDAGGESGAAYVFRRRAGTWNEESKLTAPDAAAGDEFGIAVALDGAVAVIGAWFDDDGASNTGAAYVYRFDGAAWAFEQKLQADDTSNGDRFGNRIDIDGDVLVISAYRDDEAASEAGAAYVFRYDGATWSQEQKLMAADAAAGDQFGWSVVLQEDEVIAGAWMDDAAQPGSGSAYVFRHDGGTWSEQAKLVASDGAIDDAFGSSIAIDGTTLLVGAEGAGPGDAGAAYVFESDGATWTEVRRLAPFDGAAGDAFGVAGLGGGFAFLGGPTADRLATDSGAADVFRIAGAPIAVEVAPGESIQAAIDCTCDGDEIIVQPGTYEQTFDFSGRAVTVRSTNPQDPSIVEATTIDGSGAPHVVRAEHGEGPDTVLDGLTITGGHAVDSNGGGLRASGSEMSVRHCRFVANWSDFSGGGASGGGTFEDCAFIGNVAGPQPEIGAFGGGLSGADAIRCTFIGNTADFGGGANASGTIDACRFLANEARLYFGGGLIASAGTVSNCVFTANTASTSRTSPATGGGLGCAASSETLVVNCTLTGNTVTDPFQTGAFGAGVAVSGLFGGNAVVTIVNCNVWGNFADGRQSEAEDLTDNAVFSNDNFVDPLFIDADGPDDVLGTLDDDLRVAFGSPCVDAGDTSAVPPGLVTDLDGWPRIGNGVVDIGAHEIPHALETDLDQREILLLHPLGVSDRALAPVAKIHNISGGDDATVSALVLTPGVHPMAGGFAVFDTSMTVTTSLAAGTFRLQPAMPFSQANLDAAGVTDPFSIELVEHDPRAGAWVPAPTRNAVPPGTRHEVRSAASPAPPPPSDALGDHGVFWNAELGRGYAWANLDHVGDFAVGFTPCPADLDGSGEVGFSDILQIIGAWGPCGVPCPEDLSGNGQVDFADILAVIGAWGPCP